VGAWEEAIERILDAPPPASSFEDVRRELSWDRVAEPLARIVEAAREPPPAPAAVRVSAGQELWLRGRTSVALGGAFRRQLAKAIGRTA